MNITIAFNSDGTAQCLWTEALPLHELGRLQITRASNIEFNNSTQQTGGKGPESPHALLLQVPIRLSGSSSPICAWFSAGAETDASHWLERP